MVNSKNSQFKPVITRFNMQVSHLMLKKNDILDQMSFLSYLDKSAKKIVTIQSQKILFDNITDSKSGSWLWCRIHGIPNANRIFYPMSGLSIQKAENCQIYHHDGMMAMTLVQVKPEYRIYLSFNNSKLILNMFCIRLHFQMNC